ncbi:unnamed protein product [Cochlearia groenlandica]
MASSSSSTQTRRFHVFTSFHGPDVRRGFLSHLQNHFESKGITMFKDQEIERDHSIGPELVKAIQESRLSLILLSENYASSSWCLDELVEVFVSFVLKCRKALGQTVMTIFYQVDPSSVRKQEGDFGGAFMRTCQGKPDDKQKWIEALTEVANIEGEHSLHWPNEAEMIQKIATDVSKNLNVITHPRDFDGMLGLEAHLSKFESLLSLECDDVKMVGILGDAIIGKTTIARALYNKISSKFQFMCFMANLKGSYKNTVMGVDDYDSKLWLQNQLLSKILNRKDMRVHHLGAIKEWLHDQRVLIILDDVNNLEKLKVLAKETSWFGPGSRIIVTTRYKRILKAHGINEIYNVDLETSREDDIEYLEKKVEGFFNNYPLVRSIMDSFMDEENEDQNDKELELQLSKIKISIERKFENVLKGRRFNRFAFLIAPLFSP